jgi:molybdopterin biosynthesis enzyme MoaB
MAAIVGKSLVICLPGNPKGAVECLEFVADAIPHAVDLLEGHTDHK